MGRVSTQKTEQPLVRGDALTQAFFTPSLEMNDATALCHFCFARQDLRTEQETV